MGYYRFALSLCVILSHTHWRVAGFDQGRSAVIGFFMLSGYVMTLLLRKHYPDILQAPLFYLDRAARIFPQYLLYAVLTVLLIRTGHVTNSWESQCDANMIARNLAIVPLYFNDVPYWLCTLIPPAWTLALEFMFYAVIPFIVLLRPRLVAVLVAAYSFWVYGQAFLGVIDTDTYAFRHLPGTIFIFIVGVSWAMPGTVWTVYRWSVWAASVVLFVILLQSPSLYALNSNKEILAGLVFGMPIFFLVRKIPSSRWEQLAGNLSYGMYLNHFLIILVMETFTGWQTGTPAHRVGVAVASAALAFVSFHAIENPVLTWRRNWRTARESRLRASAA